MEDWNLQEVIEPTSTEYYIITGTSEQLLKLENFLIINGFFYELL